MEHLLAYWVYLACIMSMLKSRRWSSHTHTCANLLVSSHAQFKCNQTNCPVPLKERLQNGQILRVKCSGWTRAYLMRGEQEVRQIKKKVTNWYTSCGCLTFISTMAVSTSCHVTHKRHVGPLILWVHLTNSLLPSILVKCFPSGNWSIFAHNA